MKKVILRFKSLHDMAEGIDALGLNRPDIDYGTCSFTAILNEAQMGQVKSLPCLSGDVMPNSVTMKTRGCGMTRILINRS